MKIFLLEQQQKSERISVLKEFIQSKPEARELKRGLAVKIAIEGEFYSNITKLLGIKKSCITTWKQKNKAQSLDGIKLNYQGAKSYLTPEQRTEFLTLLKTKNYRNLDKIVTYLDEHYGVIYQSKQSYYLEKAMAWDWILSRRFLKSIREKLKCPKCLVEPHLLYFCLSL